MSANGLKRKLDEDEDGVELGVELGGRPLVLLSQASFTLQRQTVLNMSLMKLYGPRLGADLRLRHRVLINNVVRRIHDDLRREGGVGALFFSSAAPSASYRQALPPPSSFSILSSSLSGLTSLDSCLTPAALLEDDLPVFFALPPSSSSSQHLLLHSSRTLAPPPLPSSPSPKDSFSSALEEIEELCPSSSSSSSRLAPPPPDEVMREEEEEEEGQDFPDAARRLEKLPASPPPHPPPSSSFLTDFTLDDVLFTDIDTSMYDLGPCSSSPGTLPSKRAPVVMSGYSVAAGVGGGAQNQPFKMDLAELDHIMEVLVGS